jgi:hypothetical protein
MMALKRENSTGTMAQRENSSSIFFSANVESTMYLRLMPLYACDVGALILTERRNMKSWQAAANSRNRSTTANTPLLCSRGNRQP